MRFFVRERKQTGPEPGVEEPYCLLEKDGWNDYNYVTMFCLYLVEHKRSIAISNVKIGRSGMSNMGLGKGMVTRLPDQFEVLDDSYFSLGQDIEYYKNLNAHGAGIAKEVMTALRDIAYEKPLIDRFQDEDVLHTSLLRTIPLATVKRQYHRIAIGKEEKVNYEFSVTFNRKGKDLDNGCSTKSVSFSLKHDSKPPTNVQALIGENGVGKTRILKTIIEQYYKWQVGESHADLTFTGDDEDNEFPNLVLVSSSSLDGEFVEKDMIVRLNKERGEDLITQFTLAQINNLKDFSDQIDQVVISSRDRLKHMLETISEPFWGNLFGMELYNPEDETDNNGSHELDINDITERLKNRFEILSTGEKAILLTMTVAARYMREGSLLLLDEPESFLHPPLLSAWIRALSDLATEMNGAVIIATHSPIVVQEIPASSVKIIERQEGHTSVREPDLETFGENLAVLTREIFRYDPTKTGFYSLLKKETDKGRGYSEVKDDFSGQLGSEALSYLTLMEQEETDLSDEED
ncbi:hypothetical protein KIMH_13790 [Bombiscardovia apis]|uniref:AAA+ ATPase domain-containing protein n=1 Tax=Bombiscardovia apis TaxID=2932182 RepID=A0ABM8BEC2_9BIFI|nr:AAA family ATPase [Bombiscardovia apis]BDR55268.1 hypothetical protein KIMH_13790 [Bombiscardovia apis]